MKISTKSFVLIFSIINVIGGFILGALVSVVSLFAPDEQNSGVGVWAILLFPVINGLLGIATGAFLTAMFNFFAARFGGIELEFEAVQ